MGKYGADFTEFTTDATNETVMAVVAAASERSELVEFLATGSGLSAPADIQHTVTGHFYDGAGAGTGASSPTPELMDQQDNAALMTTTINFTAEPTTYNAVSPVRFGFNQRGGMRWAVPRIEGVKVIGGLTEDNFGFRVDSNTAGNVEGYVQWWE